MRNESWVETERQRDHSEEVHKLRRATESGMSADDLADHVLRAVGEKQLYVFTHAWVKTALELRVRSILHGSDPLPGSGLNELDR